MEINTIWSHRLTAYLVRKGLTRLGLSTYLPTFLSMGYLPTYLFGIRVIKSLHAGGYIGPF